MALQRIPALALPPLARGRDGPQGRTPAAGELLQLTLGEALLDEILASTADGLALRLAGLGRIAPGLRSGDVVLLRVLATEPRLELAFSDPGSPPPAPAQAPRAMQADQLSRRQLVWRPPEAAALAESWRRMVLRQVDGAVRPPRPPAASETARAAVAVAAPAAATAAPAIETAPLPDPHRWLFPAYAWAGLHVMLRLAEGDDEEAQPRRRRPRGAMALRVEVDAPALGAVEADVQLLPHGVALTFFVDRDAALPVVRQAVPAIRQALADAGLRLLRCGVQQGLPPLGGATRLDTRAGRADAAAWLPPPLFRAAAEVTVALAPLLPARGLRP